MTAQTRTTLAHLTMDMATAEADETEAVICRADAPEAHRALRHALHIIDRDEAREDEVRGLRRNAIWLVVGSLTFVLATLVNLQ